MSIPANDADVTHSYGAEVDDWWWRFVRENGVPLQGDDRIKIHSAALHMHLLGTSANILVPRPTGDRECLLDIPRWDFNWQGTYELTTPIVVSKQDGLRLSCTWDNFPEN